jgi:hypothetical protein
MRGRGRLGRAVAAVRQGRSEGLALVAGRQGPVARDFVRARPRAGRALHVRRGSRREPQRGHLTGGAQVFVRGGIEGAGAGSGPGREEGEGRGGAHGRGSKAKRKEPPLLWSKQTTPRAKYL